MGCTAFGTYLLLTSPAPFHNIRDIAAILENWRGMMFVVTANMLRNLRTQCETYLYKVTQFDWLMTFQYSFSRKQPWLCRVAVLSSRNIILYIIVYLNLPTFPFWEHVLYPKKLKNGLKQLLSFINGYFAATEKNITLFASQDICALIEGIIQIWRRGQHIEKIEWNLLFLLNLEEPCDMVPNH